MSNDKPKWTQSAAIALCCDIEAICPMYGCHVALTGGVLYRDGDRKDLDLLFYRVRQEPKIDVVGLFAALEACGVQRITKDERWCIKATHQGRPIDFFFPEVEGNQDYQSDANKEVA